MTVRNVEHPEVDTIKQLATEYKERGYTVARDRSELPEFLRWYEPDLVAMSPTDNVVIEVKVRGHTPANAALERIASVLKDHPGWRFQFVAIEDTELEPLSIDEARRLMRHASQLVSQEMDEAALIVGWSAAEALLRDMLIREGYDTLTESRISPIQIVKTAFSRGLIDRVSSDVMLSTIAFRNSVIHGLRYTGHGSITTAAKSLLRVLDGIVSPGKVYSSEQHPAVSADEMVKWLHENYEGPAGVVPKKEQDDGYIYYLGGPYDPWEVLREQFPEAEPGVIEEAVRRIVPEGEEWVRRGQY